MSHLNTPPRNIYGQWWPHYQTLCHMRDRLLAREFEEPESTTGHRHRSDLLTRPAAEQQELTEILDAIKRIQQGRYGYCELTGRSIPPLRLSAIPCTRYYQDGEFRHLFEAEEPEQKTGPRAA